MSDYLSQRTTGANHPLSIATAQATEALAGIREDLPPPPLRPAQQYDEIWINIRTLNRNILGAIRSEDVKSVSHDEMYFTLKQELDFLNTEMRMLGLEPHFYVSDMSLSKYKHAYRRKLNTERQKVFEEISITAIRSLVKDNKENPNEGFLFHHVDLFLEEKRKTSKAVMLTNFPIDLLCYQNFKKLTLLESHTGAFKEKELWYTKYLNGKEECSRIPFTEKFLQIFGDKETFSPFEKRIRDEILAIAEKYKWTPMTTNEKINYGINTMKNQYFKDIYKQL